MGRVIALVSGKGGVGKTVVTANVGIALAKRNLKVCLVDADIAMANLSLLLGLQSSPITLHDVLLGEAGVQDAIYDGPAGVKLIPSGLSLENYRRVDAERLESVIESIANQFDFILLDGPAGIERTAIAAISAADEVLLITAPDPPSVADVLKTKMVVQRLGVKPIGAVLNFVRGEKGEITNEDIIKMLELPIYGLIPYDQEVRRSFMQQKAAPVILRKPNSPASIALQKTAAKLVGLSVQLDAVKKKKAGFLSRLFGIFKGKKKQPAIAAAEADELGGEAVEGEDEA
ncbi:MAG: cell division ATPase MinD [Candidatus Diapherotrites archaeon]